MVFRKRRTCATAEKKALREKKVEKNESDKIKYDLSLPVISEEKVLNDDYTLKTNLSDITENGPKLVIPKIRIKCKPLNIEKIIDYANNKVYVKMIRGAKGTAGSSPKGRQTRSRSASGNLPVSNASQNSSLSTGVKRQRKPRKQNNTNNPSKEETKCSQQKKLKTSDKVLKSSEIIKTEQQSDKKELVLNNSNQIQHADVKGQDLEADISQNPDSVYSTMNSEIQDNQELSFFCNEDDDFPEFANINIDELETQITGISNSENMKSEESVVRTNYNAVGDSTNNLQKNVDPRNKNYVQPENVTKSSLQTVVENFLKNPQFKDLKDKAGLKKGLCVAWLANKVCSNEKCLYNHNALKLFTNKLKRFPSKFIITEVVCMRNDILFVDLVMAAFKVISERKIPVVWVTFLTYFVFYVSEPSDSRFLKFWASAARFFCELKENYSTARGFASLLSIFSQGGNSEEWKIIEFIKLIKQPPIQVRINFALLHPVLKMDLPCEFLMEAVESSTATQVIQSSTEDILRQGLLIVPQAFAAKDILKVYSFIIPKISIPKVQIHVVEVLLKFCHTLEGINQKNLANDLKQRLSGKVLSFKTRVSHHEYPLTAAFQEKISDDADENNAACESRPNAELLPDFETEDTEYNYFQPEGDFCNLLNEAMDMPATAFLNPFRNTEDVCERQLCRIKQFFREYRFDLLGKYINELKSEVVDRASEEFLHSLFQMKISLQQGVDLIRIILLQCKTESAAKVIANVSITLILNLVKINKWKKAHTILSLCQSKNINLVEGKVFCFNEFNTLTQCRIVFLLIEILCYKRNYASAMELVKKHHLFSSNNFSWQLTWKEQDEIIRIRILEDFLYQIISNQLMEESYELFQLIWREQKQLSEPIDLKKFVNEILILLLNQERDEAIHLYESIKNDVQLRDTAVRAVLVSLVRRNLLSAAKYLVLSPQQTVYSLPEVTSNSTVMKVYSFWLEEEIYVIFDVFFDSLIANTTNFNGIDFNNFEIQLHESKSSVGIGLRPLCLGFVNPSFKEACNRIQRVLQCEFQPPVKLIIMPYSLKLEEHSLRFHLQKRMSLKSAELSKN